MSEALVLVGPRDFLTGKGVLLWYRDAIARKLQASRAPGSDIIRRSRYEIEQSHATFAAIAGCLGASHWADEEPLEINPPARGRWSHLPRWGPGECIVWALEWYENGLDDGTQLAEEAGLGCGRGSEEIAMRAGISRGVFNKRCRRVANILINRFRAVGLIRA